MDSSVVIGPLRMKLCLHQVYNLIFSVSIASLPGPNKVSGFVAITLRKIINYRRYLPGRMGELLVYLTAELKEGLDIGIFAPCQLEHKLRLQSFPIIGISIQEMC